ncbi:ABC transporter substrate-binding protein [Desulfogranum japonicum]|uniref:ABC transporter substrate-binding protein n=1 Tax=Desulfogranum japonicum TaxID=231447 RepID=UPI000686D865|nr:ABC transporter substrate-binding protein [Desulfogranum japonicum]
MQKFNCLIMLSLCSFFSVFLVGCHPPEPIKIGFIGGTTGRVADLGISGRDAIQLAVEEVNLEGGINGRTLQLIIKNDQQNEEKARQAVAELIEEQVEVVVGPMTSDMAMVIVPELNRAKIVCVSPTVSTEKLSGKNDYFFRVTATTKNNASQSGAYHARTGKIHRLAVLYDLNNQAYSTNWLKYFRQEFEQKDRQIIISLGFDATAGDVFSEAVNQVLAVNPEGILVIGNSMDSALICQQIRKANTHVYITLADWGATERLLELGGKSVEGATAIQVFDRADPSSYFQQFRETYLERFQEEPGFGGVLAYDAAKVVVHALKIRKKGQSLKEAIDQMAEIQGLQMPISFDEYGERKKSNSRMSIISGSHFVVLE